MKLIKIMLLCVALSSSLAFALDGLPYGTDSVRVDGGKVNIKGMNGQSVDVNGGNVNVKGMNGESVRTGGDAVNVKGMDGQSIRTKGKQSKKITRDEDEGEEEEDNEVNEVKETAPAEEKE